MAAQQAMVLVLMALGLYVFIVLYQGSSSELLLVCLVFMRIMGRVSSVQAALQSILRCNAAYESFMQSVKKAKAAEEKKIEGVPPKFKASLELKKITFSHGTNKVLSNLNVKVPIGSFTAVIGPSGTGKTTLLDLVIGLQMPDSGNIYIDGVPLSRVDTKAWRTMIAYVPQEPVLLHDSIRNNLTLYAEGFLDDELWNVLELVNLEMYVRSLPDGLNSSAGVRGLALSGGQRQRLMIARALLQKPNLLLLDEATSGLDPATEKHVLEIIASLEVTKIMISHHPAVRSYADQVIELVTMRETLPSYKNK